MIIDMRLRPPLKSWVTKQQFADDKPEDNAYRPTRVGYARPQSAVARSYDLLFREMDEAEIQWGVIMGRQSNTSNGIIPNDEIFECVDKYPERFVWWAGLDLSRGPEWWLGEIRRCVKLKGCKGISIEPNQSVPTTTRRADDGRFYPIYEECLKLDVPINIRLGGLFQPEPYLRFEDSTPMQLFKVAKDFPKLQIVCAHGGWPFVSEMIGVAYNCTNVWISADEYLVPQVPFAHEYIRAANTYFPDRTLFGTAYPSRPLRETVMSYKEWDWKPGVLDKVLYKNARRLMKMD